MATDLYHHLADELTLPLERLLIQMLGGIGLDLHKEGLEIHLAAKRIGLKITDQFVEPVVQHLPLPVGKALAGGKVD